MKKKFLLCAGLILAAALHSSLAFDEIVAFGDSLSDMGNRGIATNSNSLVYPYQTWVKQLAGPTRMDISPFNASGNATWTGTGGTNYAYGGATTQYTSGLGLGDATGRNLTNQISSRYLNAAFNTGGPRVDALHTVFIGCNDLNFAASANPAAVLASTTYLNNHAKQSAISTETQIQALATAGVKYVLWANLPDMAKIPVVVDTAGGNATILSRFTSASAAYNTEMDAAIIRLEAANPNLNIFKFDIRAAFNTIIASPATYGFTNVTGGSANDSYLFNSDKLHPTSHGHSVLADFAWTFVQTIEPEPPASAGLISYDGFNYAISANIGASADSLTDVGFTGNTWSSSNDVVAGLTKSGYPSEANAVQFTSSVGTARTILPAAIPASHLIVGTDGVSRLGLTGSSVWIAFLIRPDGADADGSKVATLNLVGASTGGGTKLSIGDCGTNANWAISKGSTFGNSTSPVTIGATTLLVVNISFVSGTGNDVVKLYVNPALGPNPPATASATLTGLDIGAFEKLEFKGNRQSTADEVSIATNWAAAIGN